MASVSYQLILMRISSGPGSSTSISCRGALASSLGTPTRTAAHCFLGTVMVVAFGNSDMLESRRSICEYLRLTKYEHEHRGSLYSSEAVRWSTSAQSQSTRDTPNTGLGNSRNRSQW
jgi:hypothetical protein